MKRADLVLVNPLGLHARAAAKLVELAKTYASGVTLHYEDKQVDGKSIMSVLRLAAPVGSRLGIEVSGDDEAETLAALSQLIEDGFGELE